MNSLRIYCFALFSVLWLAAGSPESTVATGNTVRTRFKPLAGYTRIVSPSGSFAEHLQDLPLKEEGTLVHYYNGSTKAANVYDAVVNLDIGRKDLQQCADAVMRLRAEYLFKEKRYNEITFNFTNGFKANYLKWAEGNRISVNGNRVSWVKKASKSYAYSEFRSYLDCVFTYAGTLSLSKSLKSKAIKDLEIGDVFIKGGSPGHAVIVVDVAKNSKGKKIFIVAQSYMPAQEIQILKNLEYPGQSPWYSADFGDELRTPEWTFTKDQLKSF